VTATSYLVSTSTDANGNPIVSTYSTQYSASTVVSGGSGGSGVSGPTVTQSGSGGPGSTVTNQNYALPPVCRGNAQNNTYYTSYLVSGSSTLGYITYPGTPTQTAFYYQSTVATYYDDTQSQVTGHDNSAIKATLTATIPIGYGTAPVFDNNGNPLTVSGSPVTTTYYATWGSSSYAPAPANYGLMPSNATFPASGPGGTSIMTSFAVATDVIQSSTMVSTLGYITAPEGFFYTDYPCYGQVQNTLVASTYLTTYQTTGVSTITNRETLTDSAGRSFTVTEYITTSFTATVTTQQTVYSTVVSTYYSVSVREVTATVTASPTSSSKTSTCRTAATHYATHIQKRGILGGVLHEMVANGERHRLRDGMAYATQTALAMNVVGGIGPAGVVLRAPDAKGPHGGGYVMA